MDVLVDPAFAPRIVDRRQASVYPAGPAVMIQAPGMAAERREISLPLRSGEGGVRPRPMDGRRCADDADAGSNRA